MINVLLCLSLFILIFDEILSAPAYPENYYNYNNYEDVEDRRNHKRRKRPCGLSKELPPYDNGDGKTFFDVDIAFYDIYLQNNQYPCGPVAASPPLGGGINQGLLGSHQGLLGSHQGLLGSHQGLLGSHQGLLGQQGLIGSHIGGGQATNLLSSLLGNFNPLGILGDSVNNVRPQRPTVQPDPNLERPNINAYSKPLLSAYTINVAPNKIYRQINRQINKFLKPFYDLF